MSMLKGIKLSRANRPISNHCFVTDWNFVYYRIFAVQLSISTIWTAQIIGMD